MGEARLSFFSEPSPFISSIFLCFEMQNDKKKEALFNSVIFLLTFLNTNFLVYMLRAGL